MPATLPATVTRCKKWIVAGSRSTIIMPGMSQLEIIYTAAHAHFPDAEPLGGGKAVADFLCREQPSWTVLSPKTTGLFSDGGPRSVVAESSQRTRRSASLHNLTELQYARFCRQFERA